MIYLDNNATTRPTEAVADAVREALRVAWQNPSSAHREGQEARRRVELARQSVAKLIGAKARELVFTSGGTEAIGLAILGTLRVARGAGRNVIVTTPIEHAAVRDLADDLETEGVAEVRQIRVDPAGVIDLDSARNCLDDDVAIVSAQWANNETGVIQPVAALGELCREHRAPLHIDAAQWVGKMPTDVSSAPIEFLTFSAHKFHGPKGVGGLYCRRSVPLRPLAPGAQELGRRAGTENVPGILGAGVAAEAASAWLADVSARRRVADLRDRFECGVLEQIPDAHINRAPDRLWNTSNIAFPTLEAEALLMLLSERGVCASAGAACSSGSLEPSPVLLAMGIPESLAHGSIRFSLSRETTPDEIESAIGVVGACVNQLRTSSASL